MAQQAAAVGCLPGTSTARADWTAAVVLSLVEMDACWELLELGETPWQLELPSPGRTVQERRMVVATALEALRSRGLAGDRGLLPPLVALLGVLADPDYTADARIRLGDVRAGVGAVVGGHGVIAVRQGEEVGLLAVPAAAVSAVLVDLAGPISRGEGPHVNVAADVFDAARADAERTGEHRFAESLTHRGLPAVQARALVRMCTAADQLGQFGVTVRTPTGRFRRGDRVIGLHRTPTGHYLQLRRRGQVTIAPVRRARLLELLDELLTETGRTGPA